MIVRSAYRVEVQPLREPPPYRPAPRKIDWLFVASQCVEPTPTKRVAIAAIRDCIESFYRLRPGALVGPSRRKKAAHPRQIVMYFAREMTSKSLPDIGRFLGGRDHTTIIHGIRAVQKRIETDADFAEEVAFLRQRVANL